MVRLANPRRKERFKAALAYARLSAAEWARRQGVSRGHLHLVLAGERESKTLTDAVDAFIADVERRISAKLTAGPEEPEPAHATAA